MQVQSFIKLYGVNFFFFIKEHLALSALHMLVH